MEIKRSRVLLVEDSTDDVMFVHRAFKRLRIEHALMFVSDGSQAIDYLSGSGLYADREKFPIPALMLLDLRMPKVDGFEVLKWVRGESRLKQLPITVFSGSDHPEYVTTAYELGANSFISKPFTFEDFSRALKQVASFWLDWCRLPFETVCH